MRDTARLLLASSALLCGRIHAHTTDGYDGHGLIGYGIEMYNPICAWACQASISSAVLSCSEHQHEMQGMEMEEPSRSAECYATDDAYLQTLAWCMSSRCSGVKVWKLEKYWKYFAVGREKGQPDPKESYQQALAKVLQHPTAVVASEESLDTVSLVSDEDYLTNYNGMSSFERSEDTHERYALVVFLSGVVIPVGVSLLRFVPWFPRLSTKINAWLIYPPAFGSRHKTPVGKIANIPTRGQALFILYLVAVNVVLCAVDIQSATPNSYFETTSAEVLTYITNRAGVLSFANIPLLILYASRNNALLWVTDWSHNTFLLLHRWIAWIATVEAALHSAIYLQIYVANGEHASESELPYWYWGIIATLGMVVLLPTSILPLRQKLYELFLAWHVAISVLVVAGCYLHIYYRFKHQWGYETWIFVAMAVWGFDRVMRVLRLARNGLRRAKVTIIDDDYVRVDIEGVSGNGHAYLYFPTLTWRVWENHPFSVASDMLLADDESKGVSIHRAASSSDIEKAGVHVTTTSSAPSTPEHELHRQIPASSTGKVGLTFFLRTHGGLTSQIRSSTTLPVLVESHYGRHEDLSAYSQVIGIAGGVGITGVLPAMRECSGRAKLLWGARSSSLVDELRPSLSGIDYQTFVGYRMSIPQCLENELSVSSRSVVVLVSGPASMADEVRTVVSKLGRSKARIAVRLIEESFSW